MTRSEMRLLSWPLSASHSSHGPTRMQYTLWQGIEVACQADRQPSGEMADPLHIRYTRHFKNALALSKSHPFCRDHTVRAPATHTCPNDTFAVAMMQLEKCF